MDRIKYSVVTKFIGTVVLTCSFTCFIAMLVLSIFYSEIGGDSGFIKQVDEKIAENYSAAIITELGASHNSLTKTVDEIIDGTGFKCVVLEAATNELDELDLNDKSIYVYGKPEDIKDGYKFYTWGVKGAYYNFNTRSVWSVLTDSNYYMGDYAYSDDEESTEEVVYYLVLGNKNTDSNEEVAEDRNFFYQADCMLGYVRYWGQNAMLFEIISVVVMIISAFYIAMVCGKAPGKAEIQLKFVDKIPFGIYTGIIMLIESLCVGGYVLLFEELSFDFKETVILGVQLGLIMSFFGIAYVVTIITRLKARKFWRYTILYYLAVPFRRLRAYARENLALFWRITIGLGIAYIIIFISCISFVAICLDEYTIGPMVFWIFAVMILLAAAVYLIVFQFKYIQDGVERIANGDVEHPIKTEQLVWEFKKHAERINTIGEGIDKAVQEKMKSERFKTELITNVSHDIKTPLTSIINYVDLMKKEDITDPTMLEYMDVLDRQSARLKKLIEDLMEASKASTGNLAVNLENCDISVILSQAVGEFEDKMEAKGIIPVVTYPEEAIGVYVDGRHLWRVFDNLLNNICKYAQAGTRVYINVEKKDQSVEIIFKNISSMQLNISSEELMERFVRGDSSRNTEGSGLGLSIAKSLTELMNGEMRLDVDGDLFKVTLVFENV